jgi:protein-tyrosine-phosphatase
LYQRGLSAPVYGPDWNVPDPAGQSIDRVRAIRDEIERGVLALLNEVGVRA